MKKNINFKMLITLFLCFIFLVSCESYSNDENNQNNKNNGNNVDNEMFYLNGQKEINVNYNEEYIDEGVNTPETYYALALQEVDTSEIGSYTIYYNVYDKNNNIVATLERIVNVVDKEAPTYVEAVNKEYYVGITYSAKDFVSSFKDNYDKPRDLKVSNDEFCFMTEGENTVEFEIIDTSGNSTTFKKKIDVNFNYVKLIQSIYSNTPSKYELNTLKDAYTGLPCTIDLTLFLNSVREYVSCYYDLDSDIPSYYLTYYKRYDTEYGEFKEITAIYDFYTKTMYAYSLRIKNGDVLSYCNLKIYKDEVIRPVTQIFFVQDYLGIGEEALIDELNPEIEEVLLNFTDFVENILHFEVINYTDESIYIG